MDSISHTRVANLLLDHIEETSGVKFDNSAFKFGNLKPDLTGTYLSKRHYPSLMFDEIMDRLREFSETYTIKRENGKDLSEALGEICHYLTDFFCYPHNDDIYPHNLFMHYVYEKRVCASLRRRLTSATFERWAWTDALPATVEELIEKISSEHKRYLKVRHGIDTDLPFICGIVVLTVRSLITIATTPVLQLA